MSLMKSTGIIRKVDQLGRVVLPIELRKSYNIEIGDGLEIYTEGDKIILKKYAAYGACAVTGEVLETNIEFAPGLVLSPSGIQELLTKFKETGLQVPS